MIKLIPVQPKSLMHHIIVSKISSSRMGENHSCKPMGVT